MDRQPLEQPWKQWYRAKDITDSTTTHYVVPVMAAGNQAPASAMKKDRDLSMPKAFAIEK